MLGIGACTEVTSPDRSANVYARDAARDHEALDLEGALEDRVGAFDSSGASVQPLPVRGRVRRVASNPCRSNALSGWVGTSNSKISSKNCRFRTLGHASRSAVSSGAATGCREPVGQKVSLVCKTGVIDV
jgi:hypothetical protein